MVLFNQESKTKRILVSNTARRDMKKNTGRKSLVTNQHVRVGEIVKQYNPLFLLSNTLALLVMSCIFIKLVVLIVVLGLW